MADEQEIPSFDEFIREGRERKKNEELAQKILGRKRNKPNSAGNVATRGGISKQVFGDKPTHRATINSFRGGNPQMKKMTRALERALDGDGASTLFSQVHKPAVANGSGGFSIRGMAGKFIVIAQNFAPGTTAFDIRAVLAPEGSDSLVSCKLISAEPTVIAELVFNNREAADSVVATFNNQKADGHLLHVWLKHPPPELNRLRPNATGAGYTVQGPLKDRSIMDIDEEAEIVRRHERPQHIDDANQPIRTAGAYRGRDDGFSNTSKRVYADDRLSPRGDRERSSVNSTYHDYRDRYADRRSSRATDRGHRYSSRQSDRRSDRRLDLRSDSRSDRGSPEVEYRGRGRVRGLSSDDMVRSDPRRSGPGHF